jgi:GNAT superfamily N-acetyltransferase
MRALVLRSDERRGALKAPRVFVYRSRMANSVSVVPLTPGLWPTIDALFGGGGDPKWCWCQFWRKPGSDWTNTTADDNRSDLLALVEGDGPAPGLVALEGDRAVGWVGLGPRDAFPRLARSRTLPQLPGDDVWAINCFVVARSVRGSGVAGALLEAAVAYARDRGAKTLEGYPVDTQGSRIPSASVYTGTKTMFERAGFELASPSKSKASSGTPRVVVRRTP